MDKPYFVPEECAEGIKITIAVAQKKLGDSLKSVYALGSLGYGGYASGWSDVDIDLIVDDKAANGLAEWLNRGYEIREEIHHQGYSFVDIKCYPLETLNQHSDIFEYGILNRAVMILDSAMLLHGDDVREKVLRPPREFLAQEARNLASNLSKKGTEWWDSRPIDDLAAILALPGRLIFTSKTGQVIGKLKALEYLIDNHSLDLPTNTFPWISWALGCRNFSIMRKPPIKELNNLRIAAHDLLEWSLNHIS